MSSFIEEINFGLSMSYLATFVQNNEGIL